MTKRFEDGANAWDCCPDIADADAIVACGDLEPGATVELDEGRYNIDVGEYDGQRMTVRLALSPNRSNYRVCLLGVDHEFGEISRLVVYGRPGAFEVKTYLPGCLDFCEP